MKNKTKDTNNTIYNTAVTSFHITSSYFNITVSNKACQKVSILHLDNSKILDSVK